MADLSSFAAKRPLLMSYGGGHAQIMAAVAAGLIARGSTPDLIGLTTAARFFARRGLAARSVLALQDEASTCTDAGDLAFLRDVTAGQSHPDITPAQTAAYFAIGYRDLACRIGTRAARDRITAEGRRAFLPVDAMVRYLKRTRPDAVVTTTSPRFEHAMLQAARRLGIPSLAISDLFLIRERDWIIPAPYAEHLSVFASSVREDLLQAGLIGSEIHVTGNPAFDSLRPAPDDAARRAALRARLGMTDKTVILWPAAQVDARGRSGDPYAGPQDLVPVFERLCRADPDFTYILRPHPNSAFTLGPGADHGLLDDGTLSPEEALLVADVVCAEVSTMGLQAALRGIPVICVKYAEDAVYPLHGLARAVPDLDAMAAMLLARDFGKGGQTIDMPPLGTATGNVVDLIGRIVGADT
ncbi:hypothetical protein [uncultured Sulfitobacter sp.]|uniref:hypothetical protein n=1 Tax=uncultured Sulfitobacter sp. TaxID=191468 RepID=UPI0030F76F8E